MNPIRAGLADTPETSDFTSVQRRIESLGKPAAAPARPDVWLAPISLAESTLPGPQASCGDRRASDKGFLPLLLAEYLELLDWTGRQIKAGNGGIPAHLPPILDRIGIAAADWLPLVRDFGRLFRRVAGAPRTLAHLMKPIRFHPGRALLLGRT